MTDIETEYIIRSLDVSCDEILSEIEKLIPHRYCEEHGFYYGFMHWHDDTIYDCQEDAMVAISKMNQGCWDDHAVLFRNLGAVPDDEEIALINSRIKDAYAQREQFIFESSIDNEKEAFINCRECCSRISRQYLKGNICPVCKHDLRGTDILEAISHYDSKISALRDMRLEAKKKQATEAPICWLIQYQYVFEEEDDEL